MKADVKERWCQALESGEYEQASHTLCRVSRVGSGPEDFVESFCCLGVLLNEESAGEWELDDHQYEELISGLRSNAAYRYITGRGRNEGGGNLPDGFRHRVGLKLADVEALIDLNDVRRANFKRIAAWIRANL